MSRRADPTILQMAAPLVVSFWMRSLFAVVDTFYAGTLGDAAVAAIGLTLPFELAMIAVWVGLSTGLTSNLARAMGARDEARIQQALATTWRLVYGVMPAFAVLGGACWLLAPRIAGSEALARPFAVYSAVLLVGSAATTFWSVVPDSLVKAHNDTRATMWAGIWSNVINVALNTLFTFVFHWGIFGIAFSTVLGRFGGLAYALRRAARHERERKARDGVTEADARGPADPRPYRAILRLALPSSLAYLLMGVETAVVNGLLTRQPQPTESVAALTLFNYYLRLAVTPAVATAVAMLPYVARHFGARNLDGIRRGVREALRAGVVYVLILLPVMLLAAGPLARAQTKSEVAAELATNALRLIPLACLLGLPFFLCRPAFEGMGVARPGLVVALLRYLGLTAPLTWLGVAAAAALHVPALYGAVVGLMAATAISSSVLLQWMRTWLRTLPTEWARPLPSPAP
ncbi:MAG TPA: MATE family efflux transporter [Candidatus Polarisedimenticolaceae bacterium]|nr:MATE family efflux transporter [Candidatus Polarisedimenticolaceae bacterium]